MQDHFFETLRLEFAPRLREDGFRGSGRTFRRERGEFFHVINIQGSQSGERCCVNLGVHLSFLPVNGHSERRVLGRLTESSCAFRSRLAPPGESDWWWSYGSDSAEAEESARNLALAYFAYGREHFARASEFPEPFTQIAPSDLARGDLSRLPGRTTVPLACLALARISEYRGENSLAKQFAEVGLSQLGGAFLLRAELAAIAGAS